MKANTVWKTARVPLVMLIKAKLVRRTNNDHTLSRAWHLLAGRPFSELRNTQMNVQHRTDKQVDLRFIPTESNVDGINLGKPDQSS